MRILTSMFQKYTFYHIDYVIIHVTKSKVRKEKKLMKKKMFILVLMVAFICGTLSAEAHLLDDPVARDETVFISSPYGHAVKLFEIAYGSGEGQLCRTDIF